MWLCWVAAALAGKWDGEPADVVATKVIPATPEQVTTLLADWKSWERILPCASDWQHGGTTTGPGATGTATYDIGPVRRTLPGTIRTVRPGIVVETETEGKKGWFTQVTVTAVEGGTEVKLLTPITPPKWPFTGPYFKSSKPAWERCYQMALDAIPGALR